VLNAQAPTDYFRMVLLTVVGQAFSAAGYTLEERPMQWAGGRFRFSKQLDTNVYGFIEFQLLSYSDTAFASGQPSRFRVTLARNDGVLRTLSALVVDDFGVAILPASDHWWPFRSTQELGDALAEAGHLIIGYGLPWLAGDLRPPSG
jgi:hypothetical protein